MNSRYCYKVDALTIKTFENMISDCNPDDHYLMDKIYSDSTDKYKDRFFPNTYNEMLELDNWEYKHERVEEWFTSFLTTVSALKTSYKKEFVEMVVEYD